jgi:hypothetical protein
MCDIPNKYPTEEGGGGGGAQILLFLQLVSSDITAVGFQFLLAGEHPCALIPQNAALHVALCPLQQELA